MQLPSVMVHFLVSEATFSENTLLHGGYIFSLKRIKTLILFQILIVIFFKVKNISAFLKLKHTVQFLEKLILMKSYNPGSRVVIENCKSISIYISISISNASPILTGLASTARSCHSTAPTLFT